MRPAIATGLATTRPDLDVWVISGDGDALSIGGNHLIHALRRNVRLNILMFNNQIYGLTKGQYSPTSEVAKVTKSTPFGSVDTPFNPVSLALGAEATFVARTHDMDRAHMQETFRRAHQHNGAAFVEVLQNCNVFNDGAFEKITGRDVRASMLIPLEHGKPIVFGAEGAERGVVQRPDGGLEIVSVADVGLDALLVHDEAREDPGLAFALSRLARGPYEPTPIGVFRAVERPEYGEQMSDQITDAQAKRGLGRRRGPAALRLELDGELARRRIRPPVPPRRAPPRPRLGSARAWCACCCGSSCRGTSPGGPSRGATTRAGTG